MTLRSIRDIPRWLFAVLALALACARLAAAPLDPVPDRPDLLRRTLPNGLSVVALSNPTPPGRVALQMVVHAGSLHETDAQRGVAHLLEHMAFAGSERFPPGELAPYFESLGLTFGRHQSGRLSFGASEYALELPRADDETIRAGLRFFADVAGGLLLQDEQFEDEKRIVLEEFRRYSGPEQRARDKALERLVPGSIVGRRLPMGDEEALQRADIDQLRAYYDAWHRPWNITVIAVGDAPAEHLAALVAHEMGGLEAREGARSRPGLQISPESEARAAVVTDPELTMCEAQVTVVRPGSLAVRTELDLRRSLLDQMGAWAFQRRLEGKIDTGEALFRRAEVSVDDLAGGASKATAAAWGDPSRWREIVTQLSREIERARRHGFRAREIDDARRELIAQVEAEAEREASASSVSLAGQIARAAEHNEPVPSSRQRANLTAAILSTITPDEVSGAFADRFDSARAVRLLTMPQREGIDAPTEKEVLAASLGVMAGELAAEVERARPEAILKSPPEPGRVVEIELHPGAGALSAWLGNGVRAHHRYTDYKRNTVAVAITLAGGWIEETASDRGLSAAAATAWERPAARSVSGADIRSLLTGRDVKFDVEMGRDAITLTITASPRDLEAALQVAHLLLTEPKVEAAALEQWRESTLQAIAARKTQPVRLLSEVAINALYPESAANARLVEAPEVEAVDAARAQAWLDRMVASGPVEVAVAGDIDRASALGLIERYLGSIPARERISPGVFADRRRIERAPGPILRDVGVETVTPQAVALVGVFGADAADSGSVRVLDLAAQVMTTRLLRTLRDDEQLVHSIRAMHTPAEAYPGFGLFYAASTTEPAQADELTAQLTEQFAGFAAEGPTEEEVQVARAQLLNTMDEKLREPQFWARTLADQTYRARDLNDVADAAARLNAVTREQVHEAFRAAWAPENRFTFIIRPEQPGAGEAKPPVNNAAR